MQFEFTEGVEMVPGTVHILDRKSAGTPSLRQSD